MHHSCSLFRKDCVSDFVSRMPLPRLPRVMLKHARLSPLRHLPLGRRPTGGVNTFTHTTTRVPSAWQRGRPETPPRSGKGHRGPHTNRCTHTTHTHTHIGKFLRCSNKSANAPPAFGRTDEGSSSRHSTRRSPPTVSPGEAFASA